MDEQQTELYKIIKEKFKGVPMRKTGKMFQNRLYKLNARFSFFEK